MCEYVCLYVGCVQGPKVPEDDTGSTGAGATDSCEKPNVGAGTQNWVLWKTWGLLTAELSLQLLDVILKNSITSAHGLWNHTGFISIPITAHKHRIFYLSAFIISFLTAK